MDRESGRICSYEVNCDTSYSAYAERKMYLVVVVVP